jgi:hypothetical protein
MTLFLRILYNPFQFMLMSVCIRLKALRVSLPFTIKLWVYFCRDGCFYTVQFVLILFFLRMYRFTWLHAQCLQEGSCFNNTRKPCIQSFAWLVWLCLSCVLSNLYGRYEPMLTPFIYYLQDQHVRSIFD